MIPLFLYQKRALSQPMFYLSEYLESHRDDYYLRLKGISAEGDWNSWIAFFLQAIVSQAEQNSRRVAKIQDLYEEMKLRIHEVTHSQYTVYVLDAIFNRPIFRTSDLSSQLKQEFDVHEKTSMGLLRQLRAADVLKELQPSRGNRPATLCFPRLINIAEGRDVL